MWHRLEGDFFAHFEAMLRERLGAHLGRKMGKEGPALQQTRGSQRGFEGNQQRGRSAPKEFSLCGGAGTLWEISPPHGESASSPASAPGAM